MSLMTQQPALPGMDSIARRTDESLELIRTVLMSEGTATEKAAIVRELVALQQSQARFKWEGEERQAKIDFDDALNACQSSIGRIAPNMQRNDTHSWWADYTHLDRTIRPIYTAAGFSIAFSEVEALSVGKVRIKATLSRSGFSKEFFAQITPSTLGPKGNAMATATDADAIAQSRAKRYLLLDIFNIAVGIDKEEKQGIPAEPSEQQEAQLQEWADALRQCDDLTTLKNVFADAYKYAKSINEVAKQNMMRVYEDRKRRLQ